MIHRFQDFEVDETTREVRAAGRVIALQPRVFDLLVYLARNRDRVVPKDELLDSVWPGVLVTDASLQRAISLVRTALAGAGVSEAIRTYPKAGYRLLIDGAEPAPEPKNGTRGSALDEARKAYAAGDWEASIAAFREVDGIEGLRGEDLQLWAHAAQCAGRPHEAFSPLEQAVAAYSARGDRRAAAWVALLLGQLRGEWREPVLARGWYHRAARLLEGEPECRERGYLDFLGARLALLNNEIEEGLELAQRARAAGEAFNDPDLAGIALVHEGEASLYLGRIREGLAALDEAGISVVSSGMSSWAGGLVYCGVIFSCMTRADWDRATQWTDQFTRWCEGRGVAGYPGLCRMHRAEVLNVRGALGEAETEIRATIEMLAKNAPWAEGDAWRVLGEILMAKGEFDEARQAFARATELGWESQFFVALLRFAEGDTEGAARLLSRSIRDNYWSARSQRGQALAYLVIVASACGRLDEAKDALQQLEANPDLVSTSALQALVERARGELAAAEGDRLRGIRHLRAAVGMWQQMKAPLAVAQVRCRLAELLAEDGDTESADEELAAAAGAFRQAGADGLLRNCTRLKSKSTATSLRKSQKVS